MYPAHLFSLFPPFPREDKVFVAMSFDQRFDARWRDVTGPAIETVRIDEKSLTPVRVDTRTIGDSILTEILIGIARSRVIFGDITTIGHLDARPIRNANVMYEIGLAHATRLPEEVLLYRSDNDSLPFDTANLRVNSYSPDTMPNESVVAVAESIISALRELQLQRHLAVQRAVEALDFYSWSVLVNTMGDKGVSPPAMRTAGETLGNAQKAAAISRLLGMGILQTQYIFLTPESLSERLNSPALELLRYQCTAFGMAVAQESMSRLGTTSPMTREAIRKWRGERDSAAGGRTPQPGE